MSKSTTANILALPLLAFSSITNLILIAPIVLTTAYLVYNVVFHPLRRYPGPLLWRLTPIPRAWHTGNGTLHYKVVRFQEIYGPVVRIGPCELAFTEAEAWQDIYGHSASENPKDLRFYNVTSDMGELRYLIGAPQKEHGLLRKWVSSGFSDRAMQGQQDIIGGYVDLLRRRLTEQCDNGKKALDLTEFFGWTAFDIIGNLSLGSDFQCLEKLAYNPWIRMVDDTMQGSAIAISLYYMGLGPLIQPLIDRAQKSFESHKRLTEEKARQRIEIGKQGGARPDFIEGFLNKGLSIEEISLNGATLIVAGSETTALLLSAVTYLLATNPQVLSKLAVEVRSAFTDEKEITLLSVRKLTYMLACLNEALRIYPPAPGGFNRWAKPGGTHVAGHFVPEGTTMGLWMLAASHKKEYWTEPQKFHPERWLKLGPGGKHVDPKFASDRLDASQPFSVGHRNCIGQNLALSEMRLILARIVFAFDIELAPGAENWMAEEGQKSFVTWAKKPLPVYLTPVGGVVEEE